MTNTLHIANYRPVPRQRRTALLYVLRPTSTPEQPIWDLVRVFAAFNSDSFNLPQDDGLHYMVLSAAGEVLIDTTQN